MLSTRSLVRPMDAAVRGFASTGARFIGFSEAASQSPLNEEFPGVPATKGQAARSSGVQITKLANGLTVASEDKQGSTASVGLYVKAGSRYDSVPGTAYALEYLAYRSTQQRSTLKLARDFEDLGAVVSAKAGREVFAYTGEALRESTSALVTGMAEAATQPKLTPWEVDEGVHDLEPLAADAAADPAAAVLDALHAAAFGSTSALGHALVPSKEALHHINSDVLRAFLGARFAGSNVVLAAANVDHAKLVSLAEGLLGGVPAGAGGGAGAKATYVGGESLVRTDGSGAAHVALALPAPAAGKGTYALGVLTALLGGTPAGRSGYTRQSRIAKAVAGDAGGFAKSLTAFALPYADAGLVGIAGTAADADAGKLVGLAVRLLKDAAGGSPITAAELDRAKKVYKLAYLADAESSRAGARDDLGTSILLHGARPAVAEVLAAIDAVTAADVSAIAKSALAASPSLAATGSLSSIPRYDTLAALLK